MQSKTNCRIPVETKHLAKLMEMEEVEVRFFPKKDYIKSLIKDYNFGVLNKRDLINRLKDVHEECLEENFDTFAEGVLALIKAIECRYC